MSIDYGNSEATGIDYGNSKATGIDYGNSEEAWIDRGQGFKTKSTITSDTGKPSFKRKPDNAVWYGPEQGNTGKPGWFNEKGQRMPYNPSDSLLDASHHFDSPGPLGDENNTLSRLQTVATGGFTQPYRAVTGALGHIEQGLGNILPDNYGGNFFKREAAAQFQQNKDVQDYLGEVEQGTAASRGVASNTPDKPLNPNATFLAREGGAAVPLILGGEALGIGEAATNLTSHIARPLLRHGVQGAVGGGLFGALGGATTPVDEEAPGSYASKVLNNITTGAGYGTILGGALGVGVPLAAEGYNAVKKFIPKFLTGFKGTIAPEVLTGESVGNALEGAIPETNTGNTFTPESTNPIKELQVTAKGDPTKPDTIQAKNRLQRVNAAVANKFDVPMTVGDITQDPAAMAREVELESKPGAGISKFRVQQGQAINEAINNLPDNKWTPKQINIETDLNPEDTLYNDLVHTSEAAKANGRPNKYVDTLLANIDNAKTNADAIQASLEAKQWTARRTASKWYDAGDKALREAFEKNPAISHKVDLMDAFAKIDDLKDWNNNQIYPDTELRKELANIDRTKPENATTAERSYSDVNNTISNLEEKIQNYRKTGNNTTAAHLQDVVNHLNEAKDNFTNKFLVPEYDVNGEYVGADNPNAKLDIVQKADHFYKNNVVPFKEYGLTDITNKNFSQPAIKPLFDANNPEQFKVIYDNLDPRGQQAVRKELLDRALKASNNGKNIQKWADFINKYSEQVNHAFPQTEGNYTDPELLAHLISQTPRAGISTPIENLLSINSASKLGLKSLGTIGGYAAHGPVGALGGLATELGGEAGLNALSGRAVKVPLNSEGGLRLQSLGKFEAAPSISTPPDKASEIIENFRRNKSEGLKGTIPKKTVLHKFFEKHWPVESTAPSIPTSESTAPIIPTSESTGKTSEFLENFMQNRPPAAEPETLKGTRTSKPLPNKSVGAAGYNPYKLSNEDFLNQLRQAVNKKSSLAKAIENGDIKLDFENPAKPTEVHYSEPEINEAAQESLSTMGKPKGQILDEPKAPKYDTGEINEAAKQDIDKLGPINATVESVHEYHPQDLLNHADDILKEIEELHKNNPGLKEVMDENYRAHRWNWEVKNGFLKSIKNQSDWSALKPGESALITDENGNVKLVKKGLSHD